MSTVTIPKREYEALKKDATAWRRVLTVNRNGGTSISNKKALQVIHTISEGRKNASKKDKKLPAGLRQALREVKQGKLSGPFKTVDALMAHLQR